MNVLVTGGAGFIGSHLAEALVTRGDRVRVVDDLSTGKLRNLSGITDACEVRVATTEDPAAMAEAMEGIEVVFHQAAIGSVPRSIADPHRTFGANVTGTLTLLEAARRAGVRRVVFASSSSVYGDTTADAKVETLVPDPRSPYAVSKLAGEQLCAVWTRLHGLETVALRYFNVYGPRQEASSPYSAAIPTFIAAVNRGEPPTIFGDGLQRRDFTSVVDVVRANLLAADAPGAVGRVVNVAAGRPIAVAEVARQVALLCGTTIAPRYVEPRPGDVRDSRADLTLAGSLLGYAPTVLFEDGLRATVPAIRAALAGGSS